MSYGKFRRFCQTGTAFLAVSTGLGAAQSASAGINLDLTQAITGYSQQDGGPPNNILGKMPGFFGAQIYTDAEAATTLTFELVGSEARWHSWFAVNNGEQTHSISNHPGNQSGVITATLDDERQAGTLIFSANTLLDFQFLIDSNFDLVADDTVSNGANPVPGALALDLPAAANFWVGYEYNDIGAISALLIGLDDRGLRFIDDYDDAVIRISGFNDVTDIPLPASLPLFGSALLALAIGMRRRAAAI